jgi:hypothetical protein
MNPFETKESYESPNLDIVTFELADSIAVSGESVSGLICGEEMQ